MLAKVCCIEIEADFVTVRGEAEWEADQPIRERNGFHVVGGAAKANDSGISGYREISFQMKVELS